MADGKCEFHSGFQAEIDNLKIDNEKQWEVIDKVRNRPPVWCTIGFMILTFFLGWVTNYAAKTSPAQPVKASVSQGK